VAPGQPVVLSNVTGPAQNITPRRADHVLAEPAAAADPERSY
jgi:hypothetical protein